MSIINFSFGSASTPGAHISERFENSVITNANPFADTEPLKINKSMPLKTGELALLAMNCNNNNNNNSNNSMIVQGPGTLKYADQEFTTRNGKCRFTAIKASSISEANKTMNEFVKGYNTDLQYTASQKPRQPSFQKPKSP